MFGWEESFYSLNLVQRNSSGNSRHESADSDLVDLKQSKK